MPFRHSIPERRSNGRQAVELNTVIYCVLDGETKAYAAKVREINESGLSFRLSEAVNLPSKIRIEIESGLHKIKIPARIAWQTEQNTVFGVAFETLSETIISSLADLLYGLNEKKSLLVDRRSNERRSDVVELGRELESHRSFIDELRSKLKRRVVISGMGIVCPLGERLEDIWEKLKSGQTGIAKPEAMNFENPWPGLVLGQVRSFDAVKYLNRKKAARMNRHAQLACAAALLAAENAGLKVSGSESYRFGVYLGTSIAGMENILAQHKVFLSRGIEKVQPFEWLGGSVGDSTAEISLLLKLQGPCHTICTGSASSTDALGHALRAVQSGALDAVIVGGAEAPLFLEMLSLFHRTGVLAIDEKSPLESMKPFDARRNGFVLGEGAAFLVLENMERAIKRNADIRGEIIGYGNSCDSHHAFASDPLGRGMAWAIQNALRDSGLPGSALDYVNVHGTGTMVGDRSETRAIKKALNRDAERVSMSATKPYTGHLLGATGAVETIFTLLAMQHGVIPPTLNLRQHDAECDLDFTPIHSKERKIRTALNINSGFGGKNAALILRSYDS